jgi:hypothetical protein
MRKSNMLFAGLDQSLDHAGLVLIDEQGNMVERLAIAAKKNQLPKPTKTDGVVDTCWAGNWLMQDFSKLERADKQFHRMAWWVGAWRSISMYFEGAYGGEHCVYLAMEDYAFGTNHNSYQIGEVGGAARYWLVKSGGVHLRLHDPMTLKGFTTGNYTAKKEEVQAAIKEMYPIRFDEYHGDVEGDLYDALALANIMRLEMQVRSGEIELKNLPEHQRAIFLRTTKSFSTNLLDRPFTSREGARLV